MTNTGNVTCLTHRLAHPHIRVNILAVDKLSIAAWLSGTDLTVIATMTLGI